MTGQLGLSVMSVGGAEIHALANQVVQVFNKSEGVLGGYFSCVYFTIK